MLRIAGVKPITTYEVTFEYDNDDGRGVQSIHANLYQTEAGNCRPMSHEDHFVVRGFGLSDEELYHMINKFVNHSSSADA